MKKAVKAAVYTGSRNIYGDMITAAKSLAYNSDVDVIYMLTEDDDMGEVLPDYVKVMNVSDQKFFKADSPNMRSKFTYLAMMRAALAKMFDHDKIFSLDADTICLEDVSAVWDMPINEKGNECYFSASHEYHRTHNGFLYTNTGVALYNLDYLRKRKKVDEVIEVLNRRAYTWVEQDVFNYLCQGRIHDMPAEYNANDWTDWKQRGMKIIHYAGHDDWRNKSDVVMYRSMKWDDINKRRESR